MPETAAKGKSQSTVSRDEGRSDSSLPPLRVRYYRRMKPQRVYAVEVSWQKTDKPPRGEGKEVTVRLIAAGAQVLPAEQTMDPAKPAVKAVFCVTPLAKGWLRNQKLEVLSQGLKVQEIPMASKVVSQRLTWLLLLLTFLMPWIVLEYVKNSPLAQPETRPDGVVVYKKIGSQVERFISENVPDTPEFLGSDVASGLRDARYQVAQGYEWLVGVAAIEPIAFYAGAILLGLTLVSAYLHRQKRRNAKGKPIPVAAAKSRDEEEGE